MNNLLMRKISQTAVVYSVHECLYQCRILANPICTSDATGHIYSTWSDKRDCNSHILWCQSSCQKPSFFAALCWSVKIAPLKFLPTACIVQNRKAWKERTGTTQQAHRLLHNLKLWISEQDWIKESFFPYLPPCMLSTNSQSTIRWWWLLLSSGKGVWITPFLLACTT